MKSKISVMLVFGTRPEAIKMAPVYYGLINNFNTTVCVTAQHREMLDQVMSLFGIPANFDLNIMTENQSITNVTIKVLEGMEILLKKVRPEYIFIQGDTTTAFAATLSAFYHRIPVCHVEAGLRTRNMDRPFPEEMNRRQIGSLANYHFTPTAASRKNLLEEHVESECIFTTGNTAIDALHMALKMPEVCKAKSHFYDNCRGVLVTAHRRENFGTGIKNICNAIKEIVEKNKDIHVVFPVHFNPNVRKIVFKMLTYKERITLIDPLDYAQFVRLMADAYFIMTDSGGIQEEAPSLGKPVLVLRDITERPEAVEYGTVRIVGLNTKNIIANANLLIKDKNEYNKMAKAVNPYGDGRAVARILGFMSKIAKLETPIGLNEPFISTR